jgi:hypothetical protein
MSNNAAVTTSPGDTGPEAAPVFDPDPDLVADLEGNPFALRSFRKAAQKAHDAAVRQRGGQER